MEIYQTQSGNYHVFADEYYLKVMMPSFPWGQQQTGYITVQRLLPELMQYQKKEIQLIATLTDVETVHAQLKPLIDALAGKT